MHPSIPDYVVCIVLLLIPVGIGIFYAWKDSENVTRDEYLLGGREMSMIPVTLSIFMTFHSAIALIGSPSEIYLYGSMFVGLSLGISLSYVVGCFVMVPLMYPLRMTSIFEYLEMRYQSRSVRILSTSIGMLQTYFYMVIALLAPGLALQAAAGTPFWLSVVGVGCIGTLYTAIGGFKSVIWVDVFQALVVFLGIFVLMVRGIVAVGGVENVWQIAQGGERLSIHEFSPDPRVRHTWWGMTFGGAFLWLSNVFNQSTLQRMSSMKTKKDATVSFFLNVPCNIIFGVSLVILGNILYAYFYMIRCDPLKGGIISNPNQMILVFLLHVLKDYPGLAGLYLSAIFSGALSALCSGINSLAANTVEDILSTFLRGVSERRVTIVAKLFVCVYGTTIVGVAYLARSLTGPVTQMAFSVFGACGSAVLGMFLVACTVPWANKYGAMTGGFVSLVVNIWIVAGNRLYGKHPPALPSPPTDNCYSLLEDKRSSMLKKTELWTSTSNVTMTDGVTFMNDVAEDHPSHYGFFLFEISYVWYSLIGVIVCSVITLIVSKLTGTDGKTKADATLILPVLHRFWKLDCIPNDAADDS